MAITKEIDLDLGEIPKREQQFLEDPSYSRDGLIPAWSEVVVKFKLKDLHPRDFSLLRGYYRAQQRLAEGRGKKAKKIFNGLGRSANFKVLEKERGALLTSIATFVRGPSERRRELENR
ncbi:hypothetical protein KKI19_01190 [Patescibacteria group bacterium]|nr:hypothetical protein [Patescibacteria group bacterium]